MISPARGSQVLLNLRARARVCECASACDGLESVSAAVVQWFGQHADSLQSLGAVATFLVLAVVGAVPMLLFLRAVDAP